MRQQRRWHRGGRPMRIVYGKTHYEHEGRCTRGQRGCTMRAMAVCSCGWTGPVNANRLMRGHKGWLDAIEQGPAMRIPFRRLEFDFDKRSFVEV